MSTPPVLAAATTVVDDVLWPAALEVDGAAAIPAGHLDALAAAGLYGLSGPADVGGAGVDAPTVGRVVELLAGGCLTTMFVLGQHLGALRRLSSSAPGLLPLDELCRGSLRAGVALGGCLPGPPVLTAERAGRGYRLSGRSPWVSGWGMVGVLLVSARCGDDLVWGVIDARTSEHVAVAPQDMVAASASCTVTASFDGLDLPADRVGWVQPFAAFQEQDRRGLGFNGALALGVAGRCIDLLSSDGSPAGAVLAPQLSACRAALGSRDPAQLPAARAGASALAMQAATALLVHDGSRAILADGRAQLLVRNATFCCVFASRPAIKEALVGRVAGWGVDG